MRLKDDKGAVVFGRSTLSTADKSSADHELLQDALSLIAYDQPHSSPQGYLLGEQHKLDLADKVNAAILQQKGRWPESKMERLLKQLVSNLLLTKIDASLTLNLQQGVWSDMFCCAEACGTGTSYQW